MDEKLLAVLIGVAAGAAGYWINAFWMKPILDYRELRLKVFGDFLFYAQVINAERLNDRMQQLYDERVFSNRRRSADLAACLTELPGWYRWWLKRRGQDPMAAVPQLIGYSNTTDWDIANKRQRAIENALGFQPTSER